MNMKALLSGFVLVSLAAISQPQAQTVLTYNQWIPDAHPMQVLINAWAKDVQEATKGRVRVQNTASSLGPPNRQFDLAKDGVVDLVWMLQSYTPGRFVSSEAVELPFMGNSTEALSVAYWRGHQKHFAKANEYDGVKVLSLHVHPPGHIFTTTKPLNAVSDLAGQKIRAINTVTAKILEQFGGTAVSAPATKTYEVVSRGVVDGTFFHDEAVISFKLLPYLKHELVIDGGIYNTAFALAMNKASWDKLGSEDKAAIETLSGEKFAQRVGIMWDGLAEEARKAMNKEGVKRVVLSPAELTKMKGALAHIEKDWLERAGKVGVDGKAALESIRSEAASYKR
jgi:TRAP-type C4-dicarboxylate transport system substrate-binding protein